MKPHFINKRYWILLPPFLISAILLYMFLPEQHRIYSLLSVVLFWVSYHLWNYKDEKKRDDP